MRKRLYQLMSWGFLAVLVGGCASNDFYPPSQYVGIFTHMNEWKNGERHEFKNGELPGGQNDYTGLWQRRDEKGDIDVEGWYKNGKPVGLWKTYADSGLVDSCIFYAEDGTYFNVYYYPDGLPWRTECGTYAFEDGRYTLKKDSKKGIQYTRDGLPEVYKKTPRIEKGWRWAFEEGYTGGQFVPLKEMNVDDFLYLYNDNTFAMWIYYIPYRTNLNGEMAKLCVKGRLDPVTGEVSLSEVVNYFGRMTVEFSSERADNKTDGAGIKITSTLKDHEGNKIWAFWHQVNIEYLCEECKERNNRSGLKLKDIRPCSHQQPTSGGTDEQTDKQQKE